MSKSYFLQDEFVALRLLEADDAEQCTQWMNDSAVTKWMVMNTFPHAEVDCKKELESLQGALPGPLQPLKFPTVLPFAILLPTMGMHIGNVGLFSINWVARSAEIRVLIGNNRCLRKGYATVAYTLLITYAFQTLGLHRISAGYTFGNIASKRLHVKLGFSVEGKRREAIFRNGKWIHAIEVGLLASEWKP